MGRAYNAKQSRGGEFSGRVEQNTTQSKDNWQDLSPKDKAKLIKTTGQEGDPAAIARTRNFLGQTGPTPPAPLPPRYGA